MKSLLNSIERGLRENNGRLGPDKLDKMLDDLLEELLDPTARAGDATSDREAPALADPPKSSPEPIVDRPVRPAESADRPPRRRPRLQVISQQEVAVKPLADGPDTLPQTLFLPSHKVLLPEAKPAAEPTVQQPKVEVAQVPETQAGQRDLSRARVVPSWGKGIFPSLYFSVGAVRFAVPLVLLHSVGVWHPDAVSRIPGQPGWNLGVWKHRDDRVNLIDLDVMLELGQGARGHEPGKYVIRVGNGRYGIVCNSLDEAVKMNSEQVTWRHATPNKPWVSGIIADQLATMLNINALVKMLGRSGS